MQDNISRNTELCTHCAPEEVRMNVASPRADALPLARLKARIAKALCGQKTRPVRQAEKPFEQARRADVERQQTFTDRVEEYEKNRAAAITDAERKNSQ